MIEFLGFPVKNSVLFSYAMGNAAAFHAADGSGYAFLADRVIVFTARHSRLSGMLLTPYLVWVSIATMLNLEIVRLNGPFG